MLDNNNYNIIIFICFKLKNGIYIYNYLLSNKNKFFSLIVSANLIYKICTCIIHTFSYYIIINVSNLLISYFLYYYLYYYYLYITTYTIFYLLNFIMIFVRFLRDYFK